MGMIVNFQSLHVNRASAVTTMREGTCKPCRSILAKADMNLGNSSWVISENIVNRIEEGVV